MWCRRKRLQSREFHFGLLPLLVVHVAMCAVPDRVCNRRGGASACLSANGTDQINDSNAVAINAFFRPVDQGVRDAFHA